MSEKVILDSTLFWICAALSVAFGLGVVLHRSIIYAALFLIVVFMSIAGIFVLNNADFLAISQVIVYGVGLTIVLIFGVMFTGDKPYTDKLPKSQVWAKRVVLALTALTMLAGVSFVLLYRPKAAMVPWLSPYSPQMIQELATYGSTRQLGLLLFSRYLLPFEIASILLLVAMMGAIILSKKTLSTEEDILITGSTKFEINQNSFVGEDVEALIQHEADMTAPKTESPFADDAVGLDDSDAADSPELAGVK
jgi:NADH:ubiquinone oxidoreductase subunit 6 (subunit J)